MSTIQEVLDKLQKLKEKAVTAPDLQSLQKISSKVERIRQKLTDQRANRELNNILNKIDLLVAEKNKYFRHKIIKNSNKHLNHQTTRNQQADRTLKYSKSAQNLKVIASKRGPAMYTGTLSQKPIVSSRDRNNFNDSSDIDKNTNKIKKQKTLYINGYRDIQNTEQMSQFLQAETISQPQLQIKNREYQTKNQELNGSITKNGQIMELDNEKTVISPSKNGYRQEGIEEKNLLNNEVGFLEQKLTYSFKQIDDLKKKVSALQINKQKITKQLEQRDHLSPMSKKFIIKQESVVDEYSQKLREKTFIIEDLKAKLEYFKSMNEQLKNRITNEHRRSQDYIQELKEQIINLKKQVEKLRKEKENLNKQIQDVEQKNEGLMSEVKKLVSKLEYQSKERDKVKKCITASVATKTQQLQKQIAHLSSKCLELSKVELKLQKQHEEKQQLISLKLKLQSRVCELEQESKKFEQQRNNSQMEIYKISEENRFLKNQLKGNIEAKQLLAEQLLQTKDKLEQQSRLAIVLEYENDIKIKTKLSKLKQIKGLLNQLR